MTPVLAFDIETIPDVEGIRRLHALPAELPDHEVAEVAFQKRRIQTGSDFLAPHLQRVVVISCALRDDEGLRIFSIGEPERGEAEAIQKFYDGIEKLVPQLVSWNGGGFDLPVLNHRGLIHGVTAARFWEPGRNNYYGRYQDQHLDLMDVLAMYQPRNNAPLDDVARLSGFPGKIGMDGAEVWAAYRRGELTAIRDYCEADCANTYLVFLRFQAMRGALTAERYASECELLRKLLEKRAEPHWKRFLSLWTA